MKEILLKILNRNGYEFTGEVTLMDLMEIIQHYKAVMKMLEEENIFIPQKRKTLDI